jgi:hypothetical protein
MVLSKVRFLSVVGAKLRTEVVAVRRPPKFKITIAETERLVAEHAAVWAVDDEISAARNHQIPPPEQNIQTQMVAFDYGGNKGYSGDGPVSLNMCQNCHITYITNPRSRN